MNSKLWQPCADFIDSSVMSHFVDFLRSQAIEGLSDCDSVSYEDLHNYSIFSPGDFWSHFWDYLGVLGNKGSGPYYCERRTMRNCHFFPQASLNYAENLLERGDDKDLALIFHNEQGKHERITRSRLRYLTASIASFLGSLGLSENACICTVLPNIPHSVISLLASSSQGYIFSSCSPDFGFHGLVSRFKQLEPEVLFCCDGYHYNGKSFDIRARMRQLVKDLPSLKMVVIVAYLDDNNSKKLYDEISTIIACRFFDDITSDSSFRTPIAYRRLPFDHPLCVLFSSGTTGLPKCIVHRSGGILLKHQLEHRLHCNLTVGDRLLFYTTCGWMMWNWLVSALASGVTLVLYDGSPFGRGIGTLFDIVDTERLTNLGVSAKYIDSLDKNDYKPLVSHDLSSLKSIISTGSALLESSFRYVYEHVKKDVMLQSISGGTEICGCFLAGNPNAAVYAGELQVAVLGMATNVYNAKGIAVSNEQGELVCERAFPTMPLGFWNDVDAKKYHDAYFSYFDNVWRHGDYIKRTDNGGFIIYGRSDTTLNPGGVRIGTAEIYQIVNAMAQIKESVAIGQEFNGDERIILFVVLSDNHILDDALESLLRHQIKNMASPRHVPALIFAIGDIPRTISGKISELAVRHVTENRTITNIDALANPEALDDIRRVIKHQLS